MTAHKHAELIKAKADNMELVVFNKHQANGDWGKANDQKCTDFGEEIEYFLCHPEHEDACLHWLNGGEVEYSHDGFGFGLLGESVEFSEDHLFMRDNVFARIKPRKEKRWICVTDNLEIEDGTLYWSYSDAYENSLGHKQIIEIEVEV